jgi:hypothetical protein
MVQRAVSILQQTLASLEAQKAQTEKKIKAVRTALSAITGPHPNLSGRRKRKPMTASERKSVSKRMKAYWAKRRAQQ